MVAQFTIGFKPQRLWSSLAAIDFFLGGTGAGAFLVSMYLGSSVGAVIGLLAVVFGALALLADLGRPERFWRAGSKLLLSWISRGVAFTTVFVVFGILYIVPVWIAALPWSRETALGQAIGLIAALGAVGVMIYTGFLLSHSPSIPFWNTTLLPLLFVSSALTCGVGVLFVIAPASGERTINQMALESTGILLLALNIIFLAVYMLNMNSSTVAAKESVRMLVGGALAPMFWVGVMAIGLIIPLALTFFAYLIGTGSGATPMVMAVVGILILFGGFLFRQCMLKAGVYAPIISL